MFSTILGHINWSKQDVELHQSELPKMPDPSYWRGLTTHTTWRHQLCRHSTWLAIGTSLIHKSLHCFDCCGKNTNPTASFVAAAVQFISNWLVVGSIRICQRHKNVCRWRLLPRLDTLKFINCFKLTLTYYCRFYFIPSVGGKGMIPI